MRALQKFLRSPIIPDWQYLSLKKVAKLEYGAPLADNVRKQGDVPVYGSNGPVGFHDTALVKGPGIVVGRKGTAGEVVWCDTDFFPIDTTYYVDVDTDIHSIRWLYYILRHADLGLLQASTGVPGLSRSDANKLILPVPGKDEQARIAAFLSKVDETITKTQASIDAAQKLKRGLMQNLLTGKLKPDGTWRRDDEFDINPKFGWVPKGWRYIPFGYPDFADVNPPEPLIHQKSYKFVPMDAISSAYNGIAYFETVTESSGGYSRFRDGDILMAKITPCVENGKIARALGLENTLGLGSTEYHVLRPSGQTDRDFLFYLLCSGKINNLAISLMEGTTGRQRIPASIFRNRLVVCVPKSSNEQKEIATIFSNIDNECELRKTKIDELQRLKKALMQNLLTGKVRIPPDLKIE